MKKLIKSLFIGCLLLSGLCFAQEAEKVKVTLPSGLTVICIDDIEINKKSSIEVDAGFHTLKMSYYKNDIINDKKVASEEVFDRTFDFKSGYKYALKANVSDSAETEKDFYFYGNTSWGIKRTTVGEIIITMKIAEQEPVVRKSKPVMKPIQIVELPKTIEYLEEPPVDKKYEIVGNVKFETMYSAGKFKPENQQDVVFIASQELQNKDVDAVLYPDLRSVKSRRLFSLEGIAIKYQEE